jgi:hypothetical protein
MVGNGPEYESEDYDNENAIAWAEFANILDEFFFILFFLFILITTAVLITVWGIQYETY